MSLIDSTTPQMMINVQTALNKDHQAKGKQCNETQKKRGIYVFFMISTEITL